jgi:hypothetical protein
MAEQAGWGWLYGIHRFCSTMLHPGIGVRSRIADVVGQETYAVLLRLAFSLAGTSYGQVIQGLFPTIEPNLSISTFVLERRGIVQPGDLPK